MEFGSKRIQSIDLEMEPRSKSMKSIHVHSLGDLPEDIIFHILSLLDTKEAVKTSVLSKQWRYHWTHVYSLNFHFPYLNWYVSSNFLTNVLHHRQPKKLSKLKIKFQDLRGDEDDKWSQKLILLALDYATSHQIEEFEADFRSGYFELQNLGTPAADRDFGFQYLKTLKLKGSGEGRFYGNMTDHIISSCAYLENLVLIDCSGPYRYSISHPRLVSLHLRDYHLCRLRSVIEVEAPRLKFFDLHLATPVTLNLDDCPAIDKVNVFMSVRPSFNSASSRGEGEGEGEDTYNVANLMTAFLTEMTWMCRGLREVRSGTVLLHLLGEEMILNGHYGGVDEPEPAETLLAGDSGNNKPAQLINYVLRTIRSRQVLRFGDAFRVFLKYIRSNLDLLSSDPWTRSMVSVDISNLNPPQPLDYL